MPLGSMTNIEPDEESLTNNCPRRPNKRSLGKVIFLSLANKVALPAPPGGNLYTPLFNSGESEAMAHKACLFYQSSNPT